MLINYKESIVKLFSAVDTSNWNLLSEVLHPAVVYDRPGYPRFEGIERVLQFYKCERVLACGQHKVLAIVTEDRFGACWGRFVGAQKDGCKVDELFSDVYTFEDGRIVARQTYFFRPAI